MLWLTVRRRGLPSIGIAIRWPVHANPSGGGGIDGMVKLRDRTAERRATVEGIVLVTLASDQFLMTDRYRRQRRQHHGGGDPDSHHAYTSMIGSLMITEGNLGQILGRKRAFMLGCVIYGCGMARFSQDRHDGPEKPPNTTERSMPHPSRSREERPVSPMIITSVSCRRNATPIAVGLHPAELSRGRNRGHRPRNRSRP